MPSITRRDWTALAIVLIALMMMMHLNAQIASADDGSSMPTAAGAKQAVSADVYQRLEMLEHEVKRLHGELGETWINERRAEEVKALVHEVMADANQRATLLNDETLVGYDNGFFIRTADNNYLLKIRGLVMLRYIYNHRQGAPTGEDADESGFELSRTRFAFMGHVIDPTWKFMIWAGYTSSGSTALYDAYLTKILPHGFSITAGQFKIPIWKEFIVSETSQQFVDRSLLNAKCSGSYTQGVKVDWQNDMFHLTGSLNDGRGTINTNWYNDNHHLAVTGRAEWKVFGEWNNYKYFESWQGSDPLLVFGAAVHYEMGEHGGSNQNPDDFTWTVDGLWKFGGGNIFAAVTGQHTSGYSSASSSFPGDYVGFLVQGGFFVTPELELVARYEYAVPDQDSIPQLSVATIGANYFFKRWSARLGFDVSYSFNAMPAYWSNATSGWLVDNSHGQIVVRAQMQLLF